MINLLPDDYKVEIRAGRTNVILRRYMLLALATALILVLLCAGAYYFIEQANQSAKQKVAENNESVLSFAADKSKADEFKKNLSIAKQILSNDKSYSTVALNIARILPQNVVIESLVLSPDFFNKPLILSAKGKSYQDALELKTAFQQASTKSADDVKPQPYFSNVSIQSVSKADSGDEYPFLITITATPLDGVALP